MARLPPTLSHTLLLVTLPFTSRPLVQCEDRSQVRAALPTPKRGALPLPAGLPAEQLAFAPQRVEELNGAVPQGHPQLGTPQRDARVSACRGERHRPLCPAAAMHRTRSC